MGVRKRKSKKKKDDGLIIVTAEDLYCIRDLRYKLKWDLSSGFIDFNRADNLYIDAVVFFSLKPLRAYCPEYAVLKKKRLMKLLTNE